MKDVGSLVHKDPSNSNPTGMDDWVSGLLANVMDAVTRSLAEVPTGVPEAVQAEFEYKGTRVLLQIDFEEA